MAIANRTCVSWVAYAPGTIGVNVIWIEREFNACQTHRSILYTSIFNRLHAIARYWSEIATFFLPPCILPVRCGRTKNICSTDPSHSRSSLQIEGESVASSSRQQYPINRVSSVKILGVVRLSNNLSVCLWSCQQHHNLKRTVGSCAACTPIS